MLWISLLIIPSDFRHLLFLGRRITFRISSILGGCSMMLSVANEHWAVVKIDADHLQIRHSNEPKNVLLIRNLIFRFAHFSLLRTRISSLLKRLIPFCFWVLCRFSTSVVFGVHLLKTTFTKFLLWFMPGIPVMFSVTNNDLITFC